MADERAGAQVVAPASRPPDGAVRIRLDLAYDGTDFQGWAKQPGIRTVQGLVEESLARILPRTSPPPTLVVAGRTDAGVHAAGQVCHMDLGADHLARLERKEGSGREPLTPMAALARRLRGVLAKNEDVAVTGVALAPPGFDARFSALWRRYEYRLADRPGSRDPMQRHRTAWWAEKLDETRMQAAAASLLGLHDFASFCKARPHATTIRTLRSFSWTRGADGVLVAALEADAFCHSMVRSLVGACAAVGAGDLALADLGEVRDDAVRGSAFKTAVPRGLTLLEVGYPHADELGSRAVLTRTRRKAHAPAGA